MNRRTYRTRSIAEDIVERMNTGERFIIAHDHATYNHTQDSVRGFIKEVEKVFRERFRGHGRLEADTINFMPVKWAENVGRPDPYTDNFGNAFGRFKTNTIQPVLFKLDN